MPSSKHPLEDSEKAQRPAKKKGKKGHSSLQTGPEHRQQRQQQQAAFLAGSPAPTTTRLVFTDCVEEGPDGYNHSKALCKPLPCDIPSYWTPPGQKC